METIRQIAKQCPNFADAGRIFLTAYHRRMENRTSGERIDPEILGSDWVKAMEAHKDKDWRKNLKTNSTLQEHKNVSRLFTMFLGQFVRRSRASSLRRPRLLPLFSLPHRSPPSFFVPPIHLFGSHSPPGVLVLRCAYTCDMLGMTQRYCGHHRA